MALILQPSPDDLLGPTDGGEVSAQRVDVRGVEEIDSALGGGVQDGVALGLVALKTEGHGAKA